MELFFTTDISENRALFTGDEARHLAKALRKSKGDVVHFTDGNGRLYNGVISEQSRNEVLVDIKNTEQKQKNWKGYLLLAVALTKNFNRIELLVEKAVEMGVDRIQPLLTDHTEKKGWKLERLKRIVISAGKQSHKFCFPEVGPVMTLDELVRDEDVQKLSCYLPHCYEGEKESWTSLLDHGEEICIAIGPEGDFSDREVSMASDNGFRPLSLGSQRLRTETAGMKCCIAFHLLQER